MVRDACMQRRTKSGSSKEFSAWGEGPVMTVCLAAAEIDPVVML